MADDTEWVTAKAWIGGGQIVVETPTHTHLVKIEAMDMVRMRAGQKTEVEIKTLEREPAPQPVPVATPPEEAGIIENWTKKVMGYDEK